MVHYDTADYFEMVRLYFANGQRDTPASREYVVLHLNRLHYPDANVDSGAVRRLQGTGNVMPRHTDDGIQRFMQTPRIENRILDDFHQDGKSSTREIGRNLGVLHHTFVHQVLRENNQHPYHFTRVQQLSQQDSRERKNSFEYLLNQDPTFLSRVIWTDEYMFTNKGMFTIRNYHMWATENSFVTWETSFQYRWTVKVWVKLHDDEMVINIVTLGEITLYEYDQQSSSL